MISPLSKGDKIIIVLVLLAVVFSFGTFKLLKNNDLNKAVVLCDKKVIQEILLTPAKTQLVTVEGAKGTVTLEIEEGRIRVKEASCPDRICMQRGWINREGEIIVCVPNKLVIKIEGPAGKKGTDTDTITR